MLLSSLPPSIDYSFFFELEVDASDEEMITHQLLDILLYSPMRFLSWAPTQTKDWSTNSQTCFMDWKLRSDDPEVIQLREVVEHMDEKLMGIDFDLLVDKAIVDSD